MKLTSTLLIAALGTATVARAAGELHAFIRDSQASSELRMDVRDGTEVTTTTSLAWKLGVQTKTVANAPDAHDFIFTWTLIRGQMDAGSVGVVFDLTDWSSTNFVMVPAAVYNGNRFPIKQIGYPPFWFDTKEWRLDMPTTLASLQNPTLGLEPDGGTIRLDTGDASVPLMAWQSPATKTGWMVQTTQSSRFGNHRMLIQEYDGRTKSRFEIYTPPGSWNPGDAVTIPIRVYDFPARTRGDLLNRFFRARKDLNPIQRLEALSFSEAWRLLNDLYQNHRWDERTGLYWASEPGATENWTRIWQLGWVGGRQNTLAFLIRGNAQARKRAERNIDVIFSKTQAPSGFFYGIGSGEQFGGFGFDHALPDHVGFVREQGDWLYMAQRQFEQIQTNGGEVPQMWMSHLKQEAEAFARVWDQNGQFGQFVNVETGDLVIGGSTAGAIIPGAMALASQTFHEPRFLSIAKAAARKYYEDFVTAGYTTGGPGEILSAPDSESAFGLFESYMALYEITGDSEWLHDARDVLPIFASWVVPYDYCFPPDSPMGRINARSGGVVWANVQNKHGAPAICLWSADSRLKYFRATGDRSALDLLTDIAHGVPQYISRTDHQIGNLKPGEMCERVNLSAWEGQRGVGDNIFGSCIWVETAALLTVTQLPGVYVQPDAGLAVAFDNVRIENLTHDGATVRFRLVNPTKFAADVTILSESTATAKQRVGSFVSAPPTGCTPRPRRDRCARISRREVTSPTNPPIPGPEIRFDLHQNGRLG